MSHLILTNPTIALSNMKIIYKYNPRVNQEAAKLSRKNPAASVSIEQLSASYELV
jgi:hypothetical protein